jgi:tRNA pseudouridine38-40 synthase
MDPLERHCRWHPDQPSTLDMDMLNATLRCYEGSNDFRAFAGAIEQLERKAGGKRLDTTRIVYSVHLVAEEENDDDDDATGNANYRIDFYLKGALYKQVRNMVGTALDVCRGRLSQQAFAKLLSSDLNGGTQANRDDNPCKPAPPEGLTLEHVYFDNVVNF